MLEWFGKRLRYIQEVKRDERGFTLIELLVVVIIIGILAAIAIPIFLNQRANAQDAAAESDLRNIAGAASAYFADNDGSYVDMDMAALDVNTTEGVTAHSIDTATADSFTASATSATGQEFVFDSNTGRVTEAPAATP